MAEQVYSIAGGKMFFDKFDSNGNKTGERLLGCSQAADIEQSPQEVQIYCNDGGASEKADSFTYRVDKTIKFVLKDVVLDNVGLALLGDKSVHAQGSQTGVTESFTVSKGLAYQLGESNSSPQGFRGCTISSATIGGVAFTDYTYDQETSRLTINDDADLSGGNVLDITYDVPEKTWDAVITTGVQATGSLRVIGDTLKGPKRDYYMPKVTISPDGPFSLKSDPENPAYQSIQLSAQILKKDANTESIYVDER